MHITVTSLATSMGVGLLVVLGVCELIFRVLDGPFPTLPAGVSTVNISRRALYPWMVAAVVAVGLLAESTRVARESWRESLMLAGQLTAIFSCIVLWFLHYKARRFDYGRSALVANPWFHWQYTAEDLQHWSHVKPEAAAGTWIGPDGLLFNGDYAPWGLTVYRLARAVLNNDPPPSLDFTFQSRSFGDSTTFETFHIPIPAGHDADIKVVQQKLAALCPEAEVQLL